jgi:dihydroxyacetone kinase-like predicted kinase
VVDGLAAEAVVLLPNNGNVRAAAEQAARLAVGRRVAVVPTRNPVEGLAALLAFEAGRSLEDNLAAMTAAARRVQSLAVTAAVRDSRWDGRRVRRGEIIVVDPSDALVAADRDLVRAVEAALATLRPGYELVTLYYGDEADLDEAERLAQRIRQATGGLDVEVVRGGQPHYRYFLGAEGGG